MKGYVSIPSPRAWHNSRRSAPVAMMESKHNVTEVIKRSEVLARCDLYCFDVDSIQTFLTGISSMRRY